MKISILSTLPPVKGLSHYTLGLVRGLSKLGRIDFIGFRKLYPNFLYPGGIYDKSQVQPVIENVNIRNIITYYNPITWIKAGLTASGEIIHAQWWSYPLAPIYIVILWVAKKFKHKKIILTIHNTKPHEKSWLKALLNKSVFRLGNYFIVHTEAMKEQLSNINKIDRQLISVIPMGIMPVIKQGVTRDEARGHIMISPQDKVILFFGNIREYKGLDVLLEALNEINNRCKKRVVLIIAGSPWVDWSKFQNIIDRNNLSENIKLFTKFIPNDEIETFFAASNLTILPYKEFDAQSAVAAMALNFNTPMIVSDVGGLDEFVPNNNYVFTRNNSDELAAKTAEALNDVNIPSIFEEKFRYLNDKFSWDRIAEETTRLYHDILAI